MTQESHASYSPLKTFFTPEKKYYDTGLKILSQGKVGAIVLAGGHGSRLGYDAPKGCFPIYEDKSLYQLLAQKVVDASKKYGHDLKLAIMTSDATHQKTMEHFEKGEYFGLKKEQICFFQQQNLKLQSVHQIPLSQTAPDGNGALFWHFAASGYLSQWHNAGIEHCTVFTVDNALADPFQPDLIGLHCINNSDVTVVGITRETPQEHVGVLVEKNSKLAVIEYSEMDDTERLAKTPSGLKYPLANISYFAFSMSFVQTILKESPKVLPLHKALKTIFIEGKEIQCYKSEYFIFDLLAFASKASVLLLPRNKFFAPLKNKSDIEKVKALLDSKKELPQSEVKKG